MRKPVLQPKPMELDCIGTASRTIALFASTLTEYSLSLTVKSTDQLFGGLGKAIAVEEVCQSRVAGFLVLTLKGIFSKNSILESILSMLTSCTTHSLAATLTKGFEPEIGSARRTFPHALNDRFGCAAINGFVLALALPNGRKERIPED